MDRSPPNHGEGRTASKLAAPLLCTTLTIALFLTACSTDRDARRTDRGEVIAPRATTVSRTGIPILMDLPLVGPLFGRTTRRR